MQDHKIVMIGIDGSGTKTEFILFTENGSILKRVLLGASNPNSCGMEKTLEILETGINECRKVCPDVTGIFLALAEGDGIGEKTLLTELCEKQLGTKVWDSVGKIYAGGTNLIASFAPLVFEAYAKGDKVAAEIVERTAERLHLLINHSIKTYGCGDAIVLSGSIVTKNGIVVGKLREKNGDLNFIVPKLPQVYGACVQCAKLCGVPVENMEAGFTADYQKIVQ